MPTLFMAVLHPRTRTLPVAEVPTHRAFHDLREHRGGVWALATPLAAAGRAVDTMLELLVTLRDEHCFCV